jgi:hypothetical protein
VNHRALEGCNGEAYFVLVKLSLRAIEGGRQPLALEYGPAAIDLLAACFLAINQPPRLVGHVVLILHFSGSDPFRCIFFFICLTPIVRVWRSSVDDKGGDKVRVRNILKRPRTRLAHSAQVLSRSKRDDWAVFLLGVAFRLGVDEGLVV